MTGRTHDMAAVTALGAVALSVSLPSFTLSTALLAILANLIGGITPDIDEPTAPLWRNLPVGGTIGRVVDKMLGGHRFLTHSLLGLAMFGAAAYYLLRFVHPLMPHTNPSIIWWAFMIGMLSHLIADTFTKEGVPWLLPIPYKFGFPPIKDLRVTTDHAVENLIIFPALIVANIALYITHYQQLLHLVHRF